MLGFGAIPFPEGQAIISELGHSASAAKRGVGDGGLAKI